MGLIADYLVNGAMTLTEEFGCETSLSREILATDITGDTVTEKLETLKTMLDSYGFTPYSSPEEFPNIFLAKRTFKQLPGEASKFIVTLEYEHASSRGQYIPTSPNINIEPQPVFITMQSGLQTEKTNKYPDGYVENPTFGPSLSIAGQPIYLHHRFPGKDHKVYDEFNEELPPDEKWPDQWQIQVGEAEVFVPTRTARIQGMIITDIPDGFDSFLGNVDEGNLFGGLSSQWLLTSSEWSVYKRATPQTGGKYHAMISLEFTYKKSKWNPVTVEFLDPRNGKPPVGLIEDSADGYSGKRNINFYPEFDFSTIFQVEGV